MAFDLDEEGNDEFIYAKQIKIIVKKKEEGVKKQPGEKKAKSHYFPWVY